MSENTTKQTEIVLDYMQKNGSIDAWTAIHDLNILRLGARIYDLRKLGYQIKTTMIYRKNSNGVMKRWALYAFEE